MERQSIESIEWFFDFLFLISFFMGTELLSGTLI